MENSIAKALLESYNIVSTVLESKAVNGEFINLNKIKSAFEVGMVADSENIDCSNVFTCDEEFDVALPDTARTQSVDCGHLNQICPGVSLLERKINYL